MSELDHHENCKSPNLNLCTCCLWERKQMELRDKVIEQLQERIKKVGNMECFATDAYVEVETAVELSDVMNILLPSECEHGRGLTEYCEPCGRIHGGGS